MVNRTDVLKLHKANWFYEPNRIDASSFSETVSFHMESLNNDPYLESIRTSCLHMVPVPKDQKLEWKEVTTIQTHIQTTDNSLRQN